MADIDHNKWFVIHEGRVSGPYSRSGIEDKARDLVGALIWGRGLTDWFSFAKWRSALDKLQASSGTQQTQVERVWKVKINGQELAPLPFDQLIEMLKSQADLAKVFVFTEGYSEWREVYQIHKIMDALGVSRRVFPRVPMMGTINCEGAEGAFEGQLLSISEGGLGIANTPGVSIGEKFKITIKSPNLYAAVVGQAEVVYAGNDGYAGMRFSNLSNEAKSAIVEYVRKFNETNPTITNIGI